MSFKLGNNAISTIKLGSTPVSRLYLGSTQIWSADVSDPTALLLHFDGSNGGQSFTDSSSYARTVTYSAGAVLSDAQSKFGGTSLRLTSGQHIGVEGTVFDMEAGDYTIEFWWHPVSQSPNDRIVVFENNFGETRGLIIQNPGTAEWNYFGNGSVLYGAVQNGQWHHIAVVKNGQDRTLYINGVSVSTTQSAVLPSGVVRVGFGASTINYQYAGIDAYYDDVRIIKGYAAYTSNFTPPELPFGAELSLLLHMDGSNGSTIFTDSSANAFSVVTNGNAAISTAQSKFGGASAYFDGSGDYLLVSGSEALGNSMLYSDFTAEAWIRVDTIATNSCIVSNWSGATAGVFIIAVVSGKLWCAVPAVDASGTPLYMDDGGTIVAHQWHHVAITRAADTVRLFIDGVVVATGNTPYRNTVLFNNPFAIGIYDWNGGNWMPFTGYIDELRIIKGYAAYTSNFTPPDLPFGAELALLLHMDGSNGSTTFTDSSANALTVTANGNAQISTTKSNFGGASGYFDGSSYLSLPQNFSLGGSQDFTAEAWVYPYAGGYRQVFGVRFFGWPVPEVMWAVYITPDNKTRLVISSNGSPWQYDYINGSETVNVESWSHIAVVKQGNTWSVYVNGILADTTNFGSAFVGSAPLLIGGDDPGQYFNGYIDELRIIKGYAAYTSNFTPPELPFGAEVELLLHMDGGNGSTTFTDSSPYARAFTVSNNAQISNTQSRFGASGYFDGSSGISCAALPAFGTDDFTLEAWVYINGLPNYFNQIVGQHVGGSFGDWLLGVFGTGQVFFQTQNKALFSSQYLSVDNQWHHIALARKAGNGFLFLDGVLCDTADLTDDVLARTNCVVGNDTTGGCGWNGYIDEVRIIKGYAAYTSDFTPPDLPFGAQVSLLLHMDGSDGSTTFVDSSANALTVTADGNSTISTIKSKFGGSSLYLPPELGSAMIPYSPSFDFGTGDFTVELWFYPTQFSVTSLLLGNGLDGTPAHWQVWVSDTSIHLDKAAVGDVASASHGMTTNAWYHIAVVRSSGTLLFFINGVQIYSGLHADSLPASSTGLFVGTRVGLSNVTANNCSTFGYIDELRIIKGYAAYTSNFTPPELPFGAELSLLLHMDGLDGSTMFTDSSPNSLTVTANGNAAISSDQSKFSSSAYFADGGYLNVAQSSGLNFGTGDFTIEMWYYPVTRPDNGSLLSSSGSPTDINVAKYFFYLQLPGFDTSTQHVLFLSGGGNASSEEIIPYPFAAGQWYHIAVTRSNGTLRSFCNGIKIGEQYDASFIADTEGNGISIGGAGDCYIDELRIIKGYAAYTSNFTPPDLPFGAELALLLHMDGSNGSTTFTDSSANALTVTANGNAAISTAQSKFGGTGAYFDGNAYSYLSVPASPGFTYGTGDFTIECWLYAADTSGWHVICAQSQSGNNYCVLGIENGVVIFIHNYNNPGVWTYGSTVQAGTWNHVAVCRQNGVITCYTNGIAGTPVASSFNFDNTTYDLFVGSYGHNLSYNFNGYIDELRIVKGYAAYTSNFTPPSLPFGAQVSLLLHMDSDFNDSSPSNLTVTNNGAAISTAQSRFGGASAYFDGNSSFISAPVQSSMSFGTGDFTVEAWVYRLSGGEDRFRVAGLGAGPNGGSPPDTTGWSFWIRDGGYLWFYRYDGDQTYFASTATVPENAWTHVAVTRSSGTIRFFVGGVMVGSDSALLAYDHVPSGDPDANLFYIGALREAGVWRYTYGYIDELRIIKGYAAYTSNFTPPEVPLGSELSLLLHMDGEDGSTTFTDSSPNALAVTAYSNAHVSTTESQFGGASLRTDQYGAGYLEIAHSPALELSGKDFTIEFWVNGDNFSGPLAVLSKGEIGNVYNCWSIEGDGYGLTFYADKGASIEPICSSGTLAVNTWHHIAITSQDGVVSMWVNGSFVGFGSSLGMTSTIGAPLLVSSGWYDPEYRSFSGYIDELRIVKGAALYTDNFPLPETAFGGDLALHLNFDNPMQILDVSSHQRAISNNGNGSYVTVQSSPYGNSSVALFQPDAYATNLQVSDFPALGTGDFTIEFWLWFEFGAWYAPILGQYSYYGNLDWVFQVDTNNGSYTFLTNNSFVDTGLSSINTFSWQHIAIVRKNGVVSIYVNGVNLASGEVSDNILSTVNLAIGADADGGSGFYGYMDELKIIVGYANYTADFTPPPAPESMLA